MDITEDTVPDVLARPNSPVIDAILGHPFRVLDDGFVRAVDYMGDDSAVVQAARVSYGRGTKRVHDDRGLIRYLMRHSHTTPFEMCEIKLHVRVPMDTWRQWIRHRTASVNEYSTRYSVAIDAAQRTAPGEWRLQSEGNRQGSGGYVDPDRGAQLSTAERAAQEQARHLYEERLAAGVAREQARKDLPLSTYTEAYWKVNLHNLLHFLRLRMDSSAQAEIRSYAQTIAEQIVAKWVPVTWEAFLDYRAHAVQLSRIGVDIIRAVVRSDLDLANRIAAESGFLTTDSGGRLKPNRERTELERTLVQLGIPLPWRSG
ncbi:MAG TPA: FAD-dependent thymidylate synthase [Thermoanaerobaculia bacterium]